MNEFNSINQFFSEVGCRFQCYDMGRLIQPVSQQTLIDFEQTSIPWQTPFMQHAWLAFLFWAPQNSHTSDKDAASEFPARQSHYVWFLKLPLDEQAKLNLVARDDFLRRLIEALTAYLEHSETRAEKNLQQNLQEQSAEKLHSLESAMKDNPYGFQPKQEQLANFHAIVHKQLSLPASQFYTDAQNYFSGQQGFNDWTNLGYQGIADFAARLDEKYQNHSNQELICEAIAELPPPPFQVLGHCLENHIISGQLFQAVQNRIDKELAQKDNPSLAVLCIAAIQATAQAEDQTLQAQLLSKILNSTAGSDIEVLATMSVRCWKQLSHPELLALFLQALAMTKHGQGAFNAIVSDLMFIPGMREQILQIFRSPERSEQLAQAIGAFFSQIAQN